MQKTILLRTRLTSALAAILIGLSLGAVPARAMHSQAGADSNTIRLAQGCQMLGPYATMRLTNNLFFQARAAWGKSTHELGFDGSPEDRFDADRWLVRGTLIGQWRWGPWQLRPRVSVGYIEELQETYQSSLGVVVPEQKVALGQVKGGPEISYRHKLADGTVVEPSLLLEGIWNFTQDAGVGAIDDLAFGEDLRARVEAGVMIYLRGGLSVGATVSYDGIASGDFHAIGGKVRARMPLN
jgi:hypothetical protein